jgi:hypothetical protein
MQRALNKMAFKYRSQNKPERTTFAALSEPGGKESSKKADISCFPGHPF